MDFLPALPFAVILGLGLCLLVLIATAGMSLFMLIFKAGVVVHEAQKPAHLDAGDYRLDQGREVRAEGTVHQRTENTER
jgi:hypothetical protein